MECNHGKVGEALYLKFTSDKFYKFSGERFENGTILNDYVNTSVPIHIDDSTQGNYECVCEFGVEVY